MKKLDINGITDASQFKLKRGTLQFLQDANYEALQAICIGSIGESYDPSKVYIIYGCKNSGVGASFNISAGAIFYNGEIYQVDAVAFSTSGSQVGVFSVVVTQYTSNADPVTFTDGSVNNVHNIRKLKISAGTSGSGIANWADASSFSFRVPAQLNLSATGASIVGTYPDLQIQVPSTNNRFPALLAGSITLGDISGRQDFTASFPDLGTANYYVMGSIVAAPGSTTVSSDNTIYPWVLRSRSSSGFMISVQEQGNYPQNLIFEFILFAK